MGRVYSWLFRNYIFAIIQKILGRDTVVLYETLQVSELVSGKEIRKTQLGKLDSLYQHAKREIPFYSEIFSNGPASIDSFEQFSTLPIIDRAAVSENYRKMTAVGSGAAEVVLSRTGGSSGEPLSFYTFKNSAQLGLAMMMRARAWWNVDFRDRNALFIEHGLKFEDSLHARFEQAVSSLRERLMNRVFFSAYKMSDEDMHHYYQKILKFEPVYLIGYSSFLYLFAKYLDSRNLSLRESDIKAIFYTSEMLYPWQKEVIKKVFQCPVVAEYGLKEVGVVAYECGQGNWHTMDESVYVEVIPLPDMPGIGEVVVTQLMNDASPFIRYRTGDLAALVDANEPCKCGRGLHLMGAVEGRSHDWIVTPSGKFVHGQIFTHALITHDGIKKFSVHQTKDHAVRIKIVVEPSFNAEVKQRVVEAITEIVGEPMDVSIELVEDIESGKSGKFRWIKSDLTVYDRPRVRRVE